MSVGLGNGLASGPWPERLADFTLRGTDIQKSSIKYWKLKAIFHGRRHQLRVYILDKHYIKGLNRSTTSSVMNSHFIIVTVHKILYQNCTRHTTHTLLVVNAKLQCLPEPVCGQSWGGDGVARVLLPPPPRQAQGGHVMCASLYTPLQWVLLGQ